MHYKNGRAAKNGDKVVLFSSYYAPIVGILYDAVAGNDTCNGRLAPIQPNDPCPNLKECLHVDDVLAALPEHVRDITAPLPTIADLQAILDADGGVAAGLPSAEDLDAVAAEAQLVEDVAPQPIEAEAPAASPAV
jgi:hypothetical protein